jgi:universal stress protein E
MTAAVHRAAAYAHRTGAVLHLYLFDYYGPIDYSRTIFGAEVAERARRDFLEERLQWLSQQASGLANQGLRVECDVVWAPSPYKAIIGKMLEVEPSLVIKDAECASNADAALEPSSLDWKLLRLSPAPLMLIHPRTKLVPHQIMAAVDVSALNDAGKLNDRVMEAAQYYAALSEAECDVASVFSYVPVDAYGSGFIADTYEIMDQVHREALGDFAARHRLPPPHVVRRSAFDTAQGLASCARERNADLVVLGSAYHSGVDRLMFGTTAEALLRRLSCDVLLVKPEGFRAELARHLHLPELEPAHQASDAQLA